MRNVADHLPPWGITGEVAVHQVRDRAHRALPGGGRPPRPRLAGHPAQLAHQGADQLRTGAHAPAGQLPPQAPAAVGAIRAIECLPDQEAAASIAWYELELVPGLLQTEGYARAIIGADHEEPDEVDRRVQRRIARQSLLTRATAAPELSVVLNEAIIRLPVGGSEVMSGQIRRLLDASELPTAWKCAARVTR
jgi:hypothetical protein